MNTPRWYMIDKDGMATLCTDREDAEKEAKDANMAWPHTAPHRAVQLVEVADVEALRTGYAAARLEIESLQARIKVLDEEHADELMVAHMDGRMRATQPENLRCKSTQNRLATLWGFVPAGAQQPGAVYAALSDAEIDRIVPALEHVSEDFPAEWAVWKDRERIREELRASHGQAPAQAAPQQEAQEPVAWYVTGCGRLLDEDEAKAEARHIGGTARAIPLYTAPQEDSVQDLQPVHDAVTIDLLNERVAHLERKLKEADSVLEDAARYRWLRQEHKRVDPVCHLTWKRNLQRDSSEWVNTAVLDTAIDNARKQGENHD